MARIFTPTHYIDEQQRAVPINRPAPGPFAPCLEELGEHPFFCSWAYIERLDKNTGKPSTSKMPRDGLKINEPENWNTLEFARLNHVMAQENRAGIGLILLPDNGIMALDFDDYKLLPGIDDEKIEVATRLTERLIARGIHGHYTPRGGKHFLGYIRDWRNRKNNSFTKARRIGVRGFIDVLAYCSFVSLSSNNINEGKIGDISDIIDELLIPHIDRVDSGRSSPRKPKEPRPERAPRAARSPDEAPGLGPEHFGYMLPLLRQQLGGYCYLLRHFLFDRYEPGDPIDSYLVQLGRKAGMSLLSTKSSDAMWDRSMCRMFLVRQLRYVGCDDFDIMLDILKSSFTGSYKSRENLNADLCRINDTANARATTVGGMSQTVGACWRDVETMAAALLADQVAFSKPIMPFDPVAFERFKAEQSALQQKTGNPFSFDPNQVR